MELDEAAHWALSQKHLLAVRVLLPWNTTQEAVRNFYNDVQQRIETLPGVEAAGQISSPPVTDFHVRGSFDADWLPRVVNQPAISAEIRNIAGNLLAAIGTPLLAGRAFTAADQISPVPPVLVNEAFVREFLPKGDPTGHHLLLDGLAHEIVGVVADVRGVSGGIAAEPGPVVYWPANTNGGWHRYFLVRTKAPPEQVAKSIREQIYQAGPGAIGRRDRDDGSAAKPCCGATTAECSGGCVICRGRIAAGLHWDLWSRLVSCCAAHERDWRPDGTRSGRVVTLHDFFVWRAMLPANDRPGDRYCDLAGGEQAITQSVIRGANG